MAITIDWVTKVISVPKADTTFVETNATTGLEVRELNIGTTFRNALNDLQDDVDGMVHLTTHTHNTTVTVGGVVLARTVSIINGYTVTFEDGQYAVNLVGANSNVADVTNVNQVSVRPQNSAGLQETGTSGLTASESTKLNTTQSDVDLIKTLLGLDLTDPAVVTPTSISAGSKFTINITGDGTTSSTFTRTS